MRVTDVAVSWGVGAAALGFGMLAIFFWWPLFSYACHYWFG